MSSIPFILSSLNQAMEKLQPGMDEAVRVGVPFLGWIETTTKAEKFAPSKWIQPMYFSLPGNARAVPENTQLPTNVDWTKDRAYVSAIKTVTRADISIEALEVGAASLENEVRRMSTKLVTDFRVAKQNQIWGTPAANGVIAVVTAVDSGNKKLTLKWHGDGYSMYPGNFYCKPGLKVAIDAGSDIATTTQLHTIASPVDYLAHPNTIYTSATPTSVTTGDLVVPGEVDPIAGAGNNNSQYLGAVTNMYQHIIDQTSATYQGLSRVTYGQAISGIVSGNSGSMRNLTENMLVQAELAPEQITGEPNGKIAWWMHPDMKLGYFKVMNAKKYYLGEEIMAGADVDKLKIGQKTFFTDAFMWPGAICGIARDTFKWLQIRAPGFDKIGGEIFTPLGTSATAHVRTAVYWDYGQLVNNNPSKNTSITDLYRGQDMT